MPVVSEPHHGFASLPNIKVTYALLGVLLLCLGVYFRRSRRTTPQMKVPIPLEVEKEEEKTTPLAENPLPSNVLKLQQRPPQPLPFTPPMPDLPRESKFPVSGSFEPTSSSALSEMPPRRRSYTKATVAGNEIQVSGEIVVAEGWRRHTKVFGGGVCEACAESERRMSA